MNRGWNGHVKLDSGIKLFLMLLLLSLLIKRCDGESRARLLWEAWPWERDSGDFLSVFGRGKGAIVAWK